MLLAIAFLVSLAVIAPAVQSNQLKGGLSSVLVSDNTYVPGTDTSTSGGSSGGNQYYAPKYVPNTNTGSSSSGGQYYAPGTVPSTTTPTNEYYKEYKPMDPKSTTTQPYPYGDGNGGYYGDDTSNPSDWNGEYYKNDTNSGGGSGGNFGPYNGENSGGGNFGPNGESGGSGGFGQGTEGGGNPSDKDCKNDIRDAKRMENELNQFIKRATKNGEDTSNLTTLLSQVQSAKTKLESCTTMAWDDLQSVRETLMGPNGAQTELNSLRCWDEFGRTKKDQERMQKDFERSKKHLEETSKIASDEMQKKIKEQLDNMEEMQEIQDEKLSIMEETDCKLWSGGGFNGDGEDYSDQLTQWEDLNYEMQDLSYEMDNFWNEFESVQETMWAGQMFNEVEKEMQKAYEMEYPNMPKELQAKFDMLVSTAKELIAKGRQCQKEGSTECVKEVQKRLEELTSQGSQLFGPPSVDFKEYGFDENVNKNFKDVSKNMGYGEANEIINYLLSLDPTLAEKITDPVMAKKIFKIMGRIPEKMKSEYLGDMGELKEVFDQAVQTVPELKEYKDKILGYNYFGDAMTVLLSDLKDLRDSKITLGEVISGLEALKNSSKKVEVEIGVTKFEDATTDTWYYDAANDENFNISGKNINGKQVFDASGTTTFAEMLKVLDEAIGLGQVDGDASFGPANGHWSRGYYKAVENKGVTFMDPNHKITRGEMARMMVEILGLPVQNEATPFSDLAGNSYESYVATLYSYGVIHGDAGSDKIRPNDTINRAEAFTLAKNAVENLKYATISETDMQSLTKDLDKIENTTKIED